MGFFKRYLVAGLLVWLPLGVTVAALIFLVNLFDRSLLLLPEPYRPENLLGVDFPGFGIVLSLTLILFTGMLVANFLGNRLVKLWETFLSKIPLVRTIYAAVKQIVEAFFGSEQTFQKVYLVEYPRKGLWTLGFQTSKNRGEAQIKTGVANTINLFVPTTPNPTSGFFLISDINDVIELEMSVDEALKMIISGGVVVAPWDESSQQNAHESQDGNQTESQDGNQTATIPGEAKIAAAMEDLAAKKAKIAKDSAKQTAKN